MADESGETEILLRRAAAGGGPAQAELFERHRGRLEHRGELPRASSASLAELLLGRLTTASRAAIRAETQLARPGGPQ